jgi:hypothetical protein
MIHDREVGSARAVTCGVVGGTEHEVADDDVGDALADRVDRARDLEPDA